jgi:hypothetical protein
MADTLSSESIRSALAALYGQIKVVAPKYIDVTVSKDQNGVVWMNGAFMDRAAYEVVLEGTAKQGFKGPTYDDLPVIDSHNQNVVEVD